MIPNTTASASSSVHLSALFALMLGVCLSALPAHAQDDSSAEDDFSKISISPVDVKLNIERCESIAEEQEFTLTGEFNAQLLTPPYELRLVATTGSSCTYQDACNRIKIDETSECSCEEGKTVSNSETNQTISRTFRVSDLLDEPCVQGEEQTISFFLQYPEMTNNNGNGVSYTNSPQVRLIIDLNPPVAPSEAPSVVPAEEALVITPPEVGGEASRYEACVWPDGQSREEARCQEVNGGVSNRFENLINDTVYRVVYAVYDNADNRSEDSPESEGTPASVLDFAEVYSGEYPGGERGGCQGVTGRLPLGGLALLLASLMLVRLRRRASGSTSRSTSRSMVNASRSPLFMLFVTLGLLSLVEVGECKPKTKDGRSSMNSTVTLGGGAYQPRIDDEFLPRDGVKRPYERVFEDQSPVMFQLQVERHLIQDRGLVSVGGIIGYWSVEGDGLSVTTVTETTKMTIVPYSVYGAYRFDLFKDTLPIIPMLKLGVSYYSWSIYDGSGDVASFADGSEASGGTVGWFYAIGAQFLLDVLDREMAWAFDRDAGVNHSYLTFEYQSSQVNDFGNPDSFRLGSDIYFFGITLDI